MSPPPPPLGRGRRRAAQSFDAALDDAELVSARAALAQGRWQAARSLLVHTGDEWDLRGHRVTVLAQEPYSAAWTRDWLLAEPESADAAVLLALAQVHRALRGKEKPATAREACRTAAERAPGDPTPWLGLLMLEDGSVDPGDVGPGTAGSGTVGPAVGPGTSGRGTSGSGAVGPGLGPGTVGPSAVGPIGAVRIFEEVRRRHADHHHAHHLMVARLAEHRADAGPDPLHAVYDFANWAAEQAPADSPLAVLPVVAHAERYRVLALAGHEPPDPAASGHWVGRRARQVMKAAFDWWLEWGQEGHPRRLVDLNFLAHAKVCEGRGAEAAALFHRIGEHATPAPWSYPDRAPYPAFRAARDSALGTA
ncbi:hypothetical protein [Streptomyces sp. NPDC046909]|uniref:hypothetical protein n=1 Tax=Streptomyces sp. NPDC046909 TaxID=3155617 RepID=UPI0033C33DDF